MSTTQPAVTTPRIAIIGGGPSGLTLLNVLARKDIAATLYERDEEFDSRAHLGGTLDLNPETGQAALEAAGVWDAFVAHSRPEGMAVLVTDRTGEPLFHWVPSPETEKTARPEIDRTVLRKILVDAAPAGSIKWGHALSSVEHVPGKDEWELTFANGNKTVVDLVVGADGGRSNVRPLISDAEVQYTGITGVEVSFETDKHPELAEHVGFGSVYAYDDYKSITAQRTGDGRVRIYAFIGSQDEDEFARLYAAEGAQRTIDHTLSHFSDWAPWLQDIVRVADLNAVYPRSLYMLPVGHTWTHRKGVTLTGDAMNLMTPFAGRGANIAMYGAMQLGLAIASARGRPMEEVDAKVAEHEKELCLRAGEDARVTEFNMKAAMFAPHGSKDHFIGIAKRFMAQPPDSSST